MGNKSSGHLKKSSAWNIYHNTDIRPSYAIGGKLEFNHNASEALVIKEQMIKEAIKAYERNKKPKAPPFRAENYEWSMVVNLKESSNMQDLENLSKHFNEKYGFQCYQIAIHRDEGHINEQGQKIINHHAHLEFITLDKNTGKNRSRDIWNNHKKMSEMQDEIAQILQMEREPYQKNKPKTKRIEPRALAAIKEQQKKEVKALKNELLSQKEINARLEAERKASIGQGYAKEFYRDLSALKKEHYANKEELEKAIQENKQKHAKELEDKEQEITQLRLRNQQIQNTLQSQELENKKLKEENKNLKTLLEISIQRFEAQFLQAKDIVERIKNNIYEISKNFDLDSFVARIIKKQESSTQIQMQANIQAQQQTPQALQKESAAREQLKAKQYSPEHKAAAVAYLRENRKDSSQKVESKPKIRGRR